MTDAMDGYIRRTLKNWAADQQPPENGRARLLLSAAYGSHEQPDRKPIKGSPEMLMRSNLTPLDQAMQIHNMPWMWIAHMALTPIRRVT